MSQFLTMRDVRGYRAYRRLRGGWRLLSMALLGIGLAPVLETLNFSAPLLISGSLALGLTGSAVAATGSLGGRFRLICLFLAINYGGLLARGVGVGFWGGFPLLTLLLALLAADRCLRRELGLAAGITLVPPGCLLGLLVVPFFWPVILVLGGVFLFIYLTFAYVYVAGAIPRPEELVDKLEDPIEQAQKSLTRT